MSCLATLSLKKQFYKLVARLHILYMSGGCKFLKMYNTNLSFLIYKIVLRKHREYLKNNVEEILTADHISRRKNSVVFFA